MQRKDRRSPIPSFSVDRKNSHVRGARKASAPPSILSIGTGGRQVGFLKLPQKATPRKYRSQVVTPLCSSKAHLTPGSDGRGLVRVHKSSATKGCLIDERAENAYAYVMHGLSPSRPSAVRCCQGKPQEPIKLSPYLVVCP
jgi:hypothetical protein